MEARLPGEFSKSYLAFQKYPLSIVHSASFGPMLSSLRDLLDLKKDTLCTDDLNGIVIPTTDIHHDRGSYPDIVKYTLVSEQCVKNWLGDRTEMDEVDGTKVHGALATMADPACRFVLLSTESSAVPFQLTRDCLLRILSFHQVMPAYINLLLGYGTGEEEDIRELRYCAFRAQTTFEPELGNVIPDLRRSGIQHEVCYNLQVVSPTNSAPNPLIQDGWRIRQYAVYHRLDLVTDAALWIIADPGNAAGTLIDRMFPQGCELEGFSFDSFSKSFNSALNTHLALAQWASDGWRWYLRSLERVTDDVTSPFLRSDSVPSQNVARVQKHEEKVIEAMMVMESNIKIMESLSSSYQKCIADARFHAHDPRLRAVNVCCPWPNSFTDRMNELIFDLRTQVDRGRVLSEIVKGRQQILVQKIEG
ncbi:hypothetical protein F4777DRAFT_595626 [Nemania sp. FL0916]|nr:hypothetical protein F4777DRAFT_595626 [Nemania sp. FL0916]